MTPEAMALEDFHAQVEELVDKYRVKLGLKPWREYSAEAREMCRKYEDATGLRVEFGRRSGRTTRGLLRTIARSQLRIFPSKVIYIRAGNEACAVECLWHARGMIEKLGLDLKARIILNEQVPGHVTLYTDHTY